MPNTVYNKLLTFELLNDSIRLLYTCFEVLQKNIWNSEKILKHHRCKKLSKCFEIPSSGHYLRQIKEIMQNRIGAGNLAGNLDICFCKIFYHYYQNLFLERKLDVSLSYFENSLNALVFNILSLMKFGKWRWKLLTQFFY